MSPARPASPTPARKRGQERFRSAKPLLSPFFGTCLERSGRLGEKDASSRWFSTIVVLVVATALTASCGLRTPVRPVEDTAPVIPGVVQATRKDGVVAVHWNRAERSVDGEKLDDLAAFVVERKREGSDTWEPIATVDVVDQEKIRRRRDFTWRDTEAGAAPVFYRVRAVCADGQEGPASAPAIAGD